MCFAGHGYFEKGLIFLGLVGVKYICIFSWYGAIYTFSGV